MVECLSRLYSVRDFQDWDKRGQLDLSPRFQRRPVWPKKYQSYFLDTLIRGLPTSSIHVREKLSPTKKTVREVVDGQQRLRAILDFLQDNITISSTHNEEYGNKKFSHLPYNVQLRFLNYMLLVNVLIDASDADVLDIFARLNTYTVRLNRQELRNARYHGQFKSTVYRLASECIPFFLKHKILTTRQIMRMKEAELVSELLVAMELGLQDGKRILNGYYNKYDKDYPFREEFSELFLATTRYIERVFGDVIRETRLGRSAIFYSLFCVMHDLVYGIPGQTGPHGEIPEERFDEARNELLSLDAQIRSDTPEPGYVEFVAACQRHTDNKGPRQIRHDTIKQALLRFVVQ